jgi:hypothetical protein
MKEYRIRFDIETSREPKVLEVDLKYCLKIFKLKNFKINEWIKTSRENE